MQQFKIRKEGFKELRNKSLYRIIPVYLIIVSIVIVSQILQHANSNEDANSLPLIIIIIFAALSFVVYRIVTKQKRLLESYSLILEKNLIAREMSNARPVAIYFNEISSISKNKTGIIIVKGKSNDDIIIIPAQIENYNEIENILQAIKPFDAKPALTFIQQYPMFSFLISIGLFAAFYISDNKILIAVSGTSLVMLLSWSFYKIRSNKNSGYKTKQNAWWALFISICIIGSMIMKLIAK